MKKLFREHRGGLAESLATTIECPQGIESIKAHFRHDAWIKEISIKCDAVSDDRLPQEWGGVSYYVYGEYDNGSSVVIGMSNFCG